MADEVNNVQPTDTDAAAILELEKMAFGVPAEQQTRQQTTPAQAETTAPTNTESVATEEIVDAETFTKQQLQQYFGVDNWDAAKQQFEEAKNKSTQPQELKYANDEAKKWHQYILEGKEDELYKNLGDRRKVKGVDGMGDEQKLKLYISIQNPLFDDELIDDEYNSLYKVNEDKFKNELDEVDHLGLRKEKLRTQQRIQNDVQKAADFFSQYRTKIELPAIEQQQQQDNAYESYKASMAQDKEHYEKDVAPSINNLKESDLQMNFQIDDVKNQMKFNMSITPTTEDLAQAKKDALALANYLDVNCYKDGKFLPDKLIQLVLHDRNFDKYAQTLARQAVMAERKRVIDYNTTGNQNGNRDYNIAESNDQLQQLEQFAFPGKN